VRRPARDLVLAVAVAAGLIGATAAWGQDPDFSRSIREVDGGQFLEDEPIWICDGGALAPRPQPGGISASWSIVGTDDLGREIEAIGIPATYLDPKPRAGELSRSQWFEVRPELHPLDVGDWAGGGLRAGSYDVRRGDRILARFRVLAPRGSETSVRAALARAARLSRRDDDASLAQAARLYEAVLERYPRTSYVTSIYAGLWRVRAHTRAYAADPGAWLDRIFATFHDTCFGVWALDRFMADVPAAESRPLLRRLVGLYPDTKLARAAGVYL
jgi:hypothetical protein